MRIKGQAAMEYLMTYGWAIIIIIVAVAALYAMGVFNVGGGTVPCSPCFSEFAYIDVDYSGQTVLLRNGAQQIQVTAIVPATVTVNGNDPAVNPVDVDPGDDITLGVVDTSSGDVDITVTYTVIASGYSHTDSATIRAQ